MSDRGKNSSKAKVNTSWRKWRWIDRFARKALLGRLQKITLGEIRIIDSLGDLTFGDSQQPQDPRVQIEVVDPRFYSEVVFGGTVAAGEAYMQSDWRCSNLTDLIRIMVRNRQVLDDLQGPLTGFKDILLRLVHWFNRNTQAGSRRNIKAHYDLGNDMFETFLDPSMMYSSAYYPEYGSTLNQAAEAKLKRICDKLQLCSDDHVIEIGTCLLYTSPSPRDVEESRMPSSA